MSRDVRDAASTVAGRWRVALVINPAARQGRPHARIESAIAELDRRSDLSILSPEGGEATERMARAAASTHDVVVAAGGDGTVYRALNGLAGSGTPMGVLPIGTGNDFARAFGIALDPLAATARVFDGSARPVDLVEVNGRFFGTVGVLGIGADSAITASRWMAAEGVPGALARRLGGWTYRLAGARELVRPRAADESLAVSMDGAPFPGARDVHVLFVTNTRLLGGGLRLPVDARPDDGRLEVCVVPRMPRARLLRAFVGFAQGWRVPDGALAVSSGTRARIVAARALPFSADGELVCTGTQFDVAVHHHALRVIC